MIRRPVLPLLRKNVVALPARRYLLTNNNSGRNVTRRPNSLGASNFPKVTTEEMQRPQHLRSDYPPPEVYEQEELEDNSKLRLRWHFGAFALIIAMSIASYEIHKMVLPFGEFDPDLEKNPIPREPSTVKSTILPWMVHHPAYQALTVKFLPAGLSREFSMIPRVLARELLDPERADSLSTVVLPSRPPAQTLTSGALRGEKRIQGSVCIVGRNEQEPDHPFTVTLLDLGAGLCGHPSVVHGGITATLVDESLGRLAAIALGDGKRPVTASLNIAYKNPIKVECHYTPNPKQRVMSALDQVKEKLPSSLVSFATPPPPPANLDDEEGGDPVYGARIMIVSQVTKIDKVKGKVWVRAEVLPASLEKERTGSQEVAVIVDSSLDLGMMPRKRGEATYAEADALFVVPRGFKPTQISGEPDVKKLWEK
ncbi:hypothetical protein EX30DRAFT_139483 [Ascodesmis nigricans]|uniref:Thioesterase domain-containing protein n=1 Tax=Ascodesmis nigricans TaxID=341454 RepID=A0A4V3SJ60_9PEZI|nr:hypothetical protein EX30DRAFT_139483 [Ascodesmis nigricans]